MQHADWQLPPVERRGRMDPFGSVELVASETVETIPDVIAGN